MKLTVDTLDNSVKSAVIGIGKNNGYIEAFIDGDRVCINVVSRHGDVVSEESYSLAMLRSNGRAQAHREQQIDDALWRP
jgi:hypothetical protein